MRCRVYTMKHKGEVLEYFGMEKEYGDKYGKKDQSTPIRQWWGVNQRSFL